MERANRYTLDVETVRLTFNSGGREFFVVALRDRQGNLLIVFNSMFQMLIVKLSTRVAAPSYQRGLGRSGIMYVGLLGRCPNPCC